MPRGGTPEDRDRYLSNCLLALAGRLNELANELRENSAQTTLLGLAVERVQRAVAQRPPALPPMRGEMSSSHDLADQLGQQVSERIARESDRPMPPARIAVIVAEAVQVELRRVKTEALEKAEAERQEREKLRADRRTKELEERERERDADRRLVRRNAILGLISAIFAIITAVVIARATK